MLPQNAPCQYIVGTSSYLLILSQVEMSTQKMEKDIQPCFKEKVIISVRVEGKTNIYDRYKSQNTSAEK